MCKQSSEYESRILKINADVWHREVAARIGYFRGFVLFPTKEELSSFQLHEVCDAHSQELTDFASAIYGSGVDVQVLCEGGELVFAELLELVPAWQGKGLGISVFKMILNEVRRRFRASTCIIKPDPLQYVPPHPRGTHPKAAEYRASRKRLGAYYRKTLKARPLARNSEYYIFRF